MLKTTVWRSFYQDSVVLMRLAAALRVTPGVTEVAALMGTPANHGLLAQAGLANAESAAAGPEDLVLALDVADAAAAERAREAAEAFLSGRREAAAQAGEVQPRTLDAALAQLPGANLAAISVPGAYARFEAMRALQRGLHVFLFSDNVPLADELALKDEALRRGRLLMGPDCGTAYLNGVGLGFYNRVPRGRVGCVAASGTGLQAVACHLAEAGEGLSQAIGVGGRDLSAPVAGRMTRAALERLGRDPATELVVLISKPPDPAVLGPLQAAVAALGKPAVVCCLGATPAEPRAGTWVATLEDAAAAAGALLHGQPWESRPFRDATAVEVRLAALRAQGVRPGGAVVGLYSGGTLAHEARLLLAPWLGTLAWNPQLAEGGGHRLLDLGDDAYTVGRPHPMIDPLLRTRAIGAALADRTTGVLLLDVVLGMGAHADPAGAVVDALRAARRPPDAPPLAVVATVVGTAEDPQGLAAQQQALTAAGVTVLPSNAQAARFAAMLAAPAAAAPPSGDR